MNDNNEHSINGTCGQTISALTDKYLKEIGQLGLSGFSTFEVIHGCKERRKEVQKIIREQVGSKSGIYVYQKPATDEILYVGKGKPLLERLYCHFDESIFVPNDEKLGLKGDEKKGMWSAFFRDLHPGKLRIHWYEMHDEEMRKLIERALHCALKPTFVAFQHRFNSELKSRRRLERPFMA